MQLLDKNKLNLAIVEKSFFPYFQQPDIVKFKKKSKKVRKKFLKLMKINENQKRNQGKLMKSNENQRKSKNINENQ